MVDKRNKLMVAISLLIDAAAVLLIGLFVYFSWLRINHQPVSLYSLDDGSRKAAAQKKSLTNTDNTPIELSAVSIQPNNRPSDGIFRSALFDTTIPDRPTDQVVTYTVKTGDYLFNIASQYKLKASTLLFGNYDVLQDNPELLKPGQLLNILPVDGTYYKWQPGDTLDKVASDFKTNPQAIMDFTGNHIDLTLVDTDNSGIEPGTWVVVPGGKRPIKDWGPPAITRSNPASAKTYGPGYCGEVYSGAVGTSSFVWPSTDHTISGYDYDASVHPGIDIGGQTGNAIFAADSGVVVYSGWSDFGYGYLIVLDHGNGWQTVYAHLSAVGTSCGQSVIRGGLIGAMGQSGNATGPHLHFEMILNGIKVNPHEFVQ